MSRPIGDYLGVALLLAILAVGIFGIFLVFRSEHQRRHESEDDGEPCLNCGYDTRYCRDVCSECGGRLPPRAGDYFPLRDEWPAAPIDVRPPRGDELPVVIHRTSIRAEATLIHEQFTARGICCEVNSQQPGGRLVPYEQPGPGEFAVTVWSSDEDEARAVLDRLTRRRPREVAAEA
jgi:hypothetical protein